MQTDKNMDMISVEINGKKYNEYRLKLDATIENWDRVSEFINQHLDNINCPFKCKFQIETAVEELYVNIAHYAYPDKDGYAEIILRIEEDNSCANITFIDSGIPYNPLARKEPDVTLSAEERKIGGLGIFMVKKMMDDVQYKYEDNCNILTITKNIR